MINYYYTVGVRRAEEAFQKEASSMMSNENLAPRVLEALQGLGGKVREGVTSGARSARDFVMGHANQHPGDMPHNLANVANPGHSQGLWDEVKDLGSRFKDKASHGYNEAKFKLTAEAPYEETGTVTNSLMDQLKRSGTHHLHQAQEFAHEHAPELAGGVGGAAALGGAGYGLMQANKARGASAAAAAAQKSMRNMKAGAGAAAGAGLGIAALSARRHKSED